MRNRWTKIAIGTTMLLTIPCLLQARGQDRVPQPDFALDVWVATTYVRDESDAGKEKLALYERVKDHMNKARLGVPDDRIRYFESQWENGPPIVGWTGLLADVKPIKGGYAVLVAVGADKERRQADNIRFGEYYTIIGGKVRYQGYVPPRPYVKVHEW